MSGRSRPKPAVEEFDWSPEYRATATHRWTAKGGSLAHLKIVRSDGQPITCGWDLLQRIKNETLGADVPMVEWYPPDDEVVNEINARHLWEVPAEARPYIGYL